MKLISACLCGLETRFDGRKLKFYRVNNPLPLCPEQLAGFPTPRPRIILTKKAVDIIKSKSGAINPSGEDVTPKLLNGIKQVVKLCLKLGVREAVLKSGSPSCGEQGLLYEFLKKHKIKVKWVK